MRMTRRRRELCAAIEGAITARAGTCATIARKLHREEAEIAPLLAHLVEHGYILREGKPDHILYRLAPQTGLGWLDDLCAWMRTPGFIEATAREFLQMDPARREDHFAFTRRQIAAGDLGGPDLLGVDWRGNFERAYVRYEELARERDALAAAASGQRE